ncbi:SDR family NAD(P)-dependent oxidoreductase [Saccharopolyspora flava]|uniref:NAD(P)-dependent dehydrogenase, short-chain alcohol dehydrogenase family n=1 Tax=Saccharopolyspora flava TaxID=95161 RepID=A0A1I6UFW0_9PSEU|nr:SDR family oxidoreductase [Saccharopolyspora flava]SFT00320.1 NAD(P)-dependent dehydrogenase, short-chain alcohol dehydrogenase family [Saccharopolyspora flava]
MSTRFAGKVALITGAGSGIGRAVAVRLANEGAVVFGVDLDEQRVAETAALSDGVVRPYVADISQPEVCQEAVRACVVEHGRLDVLGNIAGMVKAGHYAEMLPADYRKLMGVNVDACVYLGQAALPHLVESSGSLINMASSAGMVGQAYTAAYCASKAAVIHLTKSLAMEYIKSGIRVNAIAPGAINTPLMQGFEFPDAIEDDLLMRYAPVRRAGEAEDVAALFAFLASDEARSIHGAVLNVDNGMTAG